MEPRSFKTLQALPSIVETYAGTVYGIGTSPIETIIFISEAATSSLHAMNINFRCWCLICTTCYMKYTLRVYIAKDMSSLLISSADFLRFTAVDQHYIINSL